MMLQQVQSHRVYYLHCFKWCTHCAAAHWAAQRILEQHPQPAATAESSSAASTAAGSSATNIAAGKGTACLLSSIDSRVAAVAAGTGAAIAQALSSEQHTHIAVA
jgi:hypothetical protein